MNSINDLIEILSNEFQFFADKDYLEIYNETNNFPLLEENWNDNLSKNIIIKHKKYNISFPHEIKYDDSKENITKQIEEMCKKYKRRIERFLKLIKDPSVKKIFFRISSKKDNQELLENVLNKICINYEFKCINKGTAKYSSWKKDELNWDFIFNL